MIGDLYDATKVVVGQAAVFFAPKGTVLPPLSGWNAADPFDPAFWPSPDWTPCGATDQGWAFGANKSTQTINIEEQSTPVAVTLTSQAVTIAGALSEDITKTLALALNGTSAATAAVVGTSPGYDKISLSDSPIEYAIGMVMQNAEGFGRIIYAPAWTQLANVTVNLRRATDKRNYPVQFETVCKTSDIAIYNFTASK